MKHINQSEKLRILELHSKYKNILLEQTTDVRSQLQALVDKGCPTGVVVQMKNTNPKYAYAIKQTNSNNDVRYLYIDNTIVLVDPSTKKLVPSKQKWSCDNYYKKDEVNKQQNQQEWLLAKDTGATREELSNPAMYETKIIDGSKYYRSKAVNGVFGGNTKRQLELINSWKKDQNGNDLPWKTINEITQAEYEVSYRVIASPASEKLFPIDLIMCIPPDKVTTITDEFGGTSQLNQKSCNTKIINFYKEWESDTRKLNGQFAIDKLQVERCVQTFKQGRLGKADNYVDVLTGKRTGGRNNTSPNAKSRFRLFNNVYRFTQ